MNIKSTLAALIFGLMLPMFGLAQSSNLGNWLIYIGNKKINSKWNIHHEVQHRNYNAIGDLEQLLLRTGLGYNIKDNANILLGYGYILSENYLNDLDEDKVAIGEHRIFQQFISKQKIGSVALSHRYRFEQRFVGEDFRMRFRYFLGINIPLDKKNGSNKFYLSLYNEIFLNDMNRVFDRNRLYAGLGLKVNDQIKVELGYMNQFLDMSNRDQINIFTFANF